MSITQRTELALRKHQVRIEIDSIIVHFRTVPPNWIPTTVDANGKHQMWKLGKWEGGITNASIEMLNK